MLISYCPYDALVLEYKGTLKPVCVKDKEEPYPYS